MPAAPKTIFYCRKCRKAVLKSDAVRKPHYVYRYICPDCGSDMEEHYNRMGVTYMEIKRGRLTVTKTRWIINE